MSGGYPIDCFINMPLNIPTIQYSTITVHSNGHTISQLLYFCIRSAKKECEAYSCLLYRHTPFIQDRSINRMHSMDALKKKKNIDCDTRYKPTATKSSRTNPASENLAGWLLYLVTLNELYSQLLQHKALQVAAVLPVLKTSMSWKPQSLNNEIWIHWQTAPDEKKMPNSSLGSS